MVLPDVKHHGVAELRRRFGEAGPALYRATVDAVLDVEKFAADSGEDIGFSRTGGMTSEAGCGWGAAWSREVSAKQRWTAVWSREVSVKQRWTAVWSREVSAKRRGERRLE